MILSVLYAVFLFITEFCILFFNFIVSEHNDHYENMVMDFEWVGLAVYL
ncbi:hypothetical protein KKH3_27880 [Pectobacterium actinidiae]|nr:hypothetical protein KKH3_27880 [Pectobacterium actinidiae]